MGYGLASAIGAAYTTKQPVIAITGDAGLAMVIGELGLARRLKLPVIVVVIGGVVVGWSVTTLIDWMSSE